MARIRFPSSNGNRPAGLALSPALWLLLWAALGAGFWGEGGSGKPSPGRKEQGLPRPTGGLGNPRSDGAGPKAADPMGRSLGTWWRRQTPLKPAHRATGALGGLRDALGTKGPEPFLHHLLCLRAPQLQGPHKGKLRSATTAGGTGGWPSLGWTRSEVMLWKRGRAEQMTQQLPSPR